MKKVSKILSATIGIISLIGIVPVLAESNDSAYTQTLKRVPDYSSQDNTPISIPADGDSQNLNIGWTYTQYAHYYCKDENRIKVTGWQQIDGKWFYFDPSNYDMQTGWLNDGGSWYYLTGPSDLPKGKLQAKYGFGAMQTGWLNKDDKWYFLNNNGSMNANCWLKINGKWYYFYGDGTMAADTTIDGYRVGSDGAWIA